MVARCILFSVYQELLSFVYVMVLLQLFQLNSVQIRPGVDYIEVITIAIMITL